MFCQGCGKEMGEGANFCSNCGRKTEVAAPPPAFTPAAGQRLYRSRSNRMIAGVCAGLAERFGVDPTVMRLIVVLLFFTGFSVLAYPIAWVIIPEEPLPSAQMAGPVHS